MFAYAGLVALIAGTALVRGEAVPTVPGPGDKYTVGQSCQIAWEPDITGLWKVMNIQLMTGSNLAMQHITTVATVDGTDTTKTTFEYPCPDVTPNAAIYFYQFSSPANATDLTWVTRFTIRGADGSETEPENPTQDGQDIPWGVGKLVDPSTAVPAPSYLTQGSTGTTVTSDSTTSTPSTSSTPSGSTTGSTQTGNTAGTTPPKAPAAPVTTPSTSTGSTNTTGNTSNENGAVSAFGVDNHLFRAGLALGAAAFTFAFAL